MSTFSKEDIEDLLYNVLDVYKVNQWKGDKIQFTCPVHGERNPSCGINISYASPEDTTERAVFNCFSCGAKGSIAKLLFLAQPDKFRSISKAQIFLKQRYGVNVKFLNLKNQSTEIKRYEDKFIDIETDNKVLPLSTIAPFRSGKETYQYFFKRGFDKSDMQKFMIGRDLTNETVTIPIFWENNKLAGVIGRYIDPNRPKNSRFMVYNFERSSIIYPLNLLEVSNDTIILVEACLDVIMLHKWGFTNAVATMTNKVSKKQAEQIKSRCTKLIILADIDDRGKDLINTAKYYLGSSIQILIPTYTPEFGKDPCEWGEIETIKVVNSARPFGFNRLPRK